MQPIQNSVLSPWTPLLDKDRAQAAVASLHEITAELQAALETHKQVQQRQQPYSSNAQLGEGAAGIAVFFAYLEAAGFLAGARDLALEYLNVSIDALTSQPMDPSLFSGFAGISWAVQHVSNLLGNASDDLTEIDLVLEKFVSNSPWKQDYDLIVGLVGIGVYCLERSGSAAAARSLELIVDRLYELAERGEEGVRWFTKPELLIQQQREIYPQGYYNLGTAHGVPGIIAILGKIYAAGIAREKTSWLLDEAVRWFLQQRLPAEMNSCFSGFCIPGRHSEDSRLAWCYGDAGIAAALFIAGRCTGQSPWEEEALAIARHSANRVPETCRVRDVCFCHGSAGLAHIFNRFYQATRDELFASASRYWIEQSLQYRKPGSGAAGYTVWTADQDGQIVSLGRHGLIEGIAGVGLTYLAAMSTVEPSWDRIFLVDLPFQAARKEWVVGQFP